MCRHWPRLPTLPICLDWFYRFGLLTLLVVLLTLDGKKDTGLWVSFLFLITSDITYPIKISAFLLSKNNNQLYQYKSIISTEARIQIIETDAYMIWDTHNTVFLFTPTKPDFFIRNTSETIFLEKKVSPQLKIIINIGM